MSVEELNAPNFGLLLSRFIDSGQWERALETAREWLAVDAENARANLGAGQALLNLKRYKEAEPYLRRVLAIQPGSSTAHRFLSIALFNTKRFQEADAEVQQAISLSPHDHYNWYHLAWMFYRQGDKVLAAKYAGRARELAPRDADVVNLLALCASAENVGLRLQQYQEALELDPENPQVHNNLGAYYMNVPHDFARAEECFRRALHFDPSMKMARQNLFTALKHRDKVYRALCAPRDWMLKCFGFMRTARRKNFLFYLLLIPLWIYLFRFVIAGLILWCLLVWPMVKVYEFLTIGDIRHHAGELGSRRGGFLGYRKLPVKVRLGIFGGCLISFWVGVGMLIAYGGSSGERSNVVAIVAGLLVGAVLVWLVFIQVRAMLVRSWKKSLSRKRARQVEGILETETDSR
jgi:tetratricopeptide (TPR) repeat protein